jgi:hypothetical protein
MRDAKDDAMYHVSCIRFCNLIACFKDTDDVTRHDEDDLICLECMTWVISPLWNV